MEINGKDYGNIFLAPIAGVSEVGFRTVCKMAGADLTYTEMVNATALIHDSEKTKELLITETIENPVAVQIFGHDASHMAKVCTMPELEKFDIIDINFGCPAPKIVKNGDGSALLKDLKKVRNIVESVVRATNKPVSCKFRIGFNNGENVAVDMAKLCEEAGAKFITVHGRTREQMYSGKVDLETIAKVKQFVNIPVVGNGDVIDLSSYNNMLSTGVDAVMIGRGALGNPNVFNQLKGNIEINKFDLVKMHYNTLKKYFSARYINATLRKHLLWYVAGIKNASQLKQKIATCEDSVVALALVKELLES